MTYDLKAELAAAVRELMREPATGVAEAPDRVLAHLTAHSQHGRRAVWDPSRG